MKIFFIISFFISIALTPASSQPAQDMYETARKHAHAGEYNQAKELLNTILLANTEHYDAKFLLAQVHAWNREYELSTALLSQLIHDFMPTPDAYEMLARVKMWQDAYPQCQEVCEAGLKLFPSLTSLRLLKAQALLKMDQPDPAIEVLNNILLYDSSHTEAKQLLEQLEFLKLRNAVIVDYGYARFSNTFSPWHTAALSYRRNTGLGPVTARMTNAYMFNQFGIQYELDAYPRINKKSYTYVNMGTSNYAIFPKFRFGAEYFRLFPKQFEISGGVRNLSFHQTHVVIYTAQVGRYTNHYWMSARGFLTSLDHQHHSTGAFTLRRYLENPDHYFSVYANTGTTPLSVVSLNEIRRLNAQSIAVDYQYPAFKRSLLLKARAEYQQETYEEIRTTNRFTVLFSLEKRF